MKEIKDLQPGDYVRCEYGYGANNWGKDQVIRVTATQVLLRNCKAKFRRSDGSMIGAKRWEHGRIECWTEAHQKALDERERVIRNKRILIAAGNFDPKALTEEQYQAIAEVVAV